MRRREVRDPVHNDSTLYLIAFVVGGVLLVACVVWVSLTLGTAQHVPGPLAALVWLAQGRLQWTWPATLIAISAVLLLAAAAAGIGMVWGARRARRTRVDDAARHLARVPEVASLTERACANTARKLRVALRPGAPAGLQLGRHVPAGAMLRSDYESLSCDIWGPRSGKTTSRVIPAILDAPGAVVATSNKRDVVDATRDVREEMGSRVWVFDPQKVCNEPASWWWDPLSWVTDEVKAADLAAHFADSDDGADAKKDAFFDPEGQDLLASLFLAAAIATFPITQVYTWVSNEQDQSPVAILRGAGYELIADGLLGQYNAPDKQRGGVFGTAKKMVRALKIRGIHPWVTRNGPFDRRPHFDPREFVNSGGTLYSLSREGNGSAGPLVTALTVAVITAAEELATASPGGRLPVPMTCPLDELANVVRWRDLPALFSHFGSRGIIIMAILQSWEQGVEVWGARGFGKLWSAANIKVYGGGVAIADDGFLRSMSTAIGDHYEITGSVSGGQGLFGRNTSRQRQEKRTLTEADLEALPRGRAIVRSSGNPPVMVATVPWWDGPHADAIRASIARHEPAATNEPELGEAV